MKYCTWKPVRYPCLSRGACNLWATPHAFFRIATGIHRRSSSWGTWSPLLERRPHVRLTDIGTRTCTRKPHIHIVSAKLWIWISVSISSLSAQKLFSSLLRSCFIELHTSGLFHIWCKYSSWWIHWFMSNTTVVHMMFHTITTRVREVSPRGCPDGFALYKVGTPNMLSMFKSMKHQICWACLNLWSLRIATRV